LGKIDEDLEMEDSSEEEEEAILNRKGKGKKKEIRSQLSQLGAELGDYKVTPAVPEVKNLFGAGTPRQGESKPWTKESTQGTIEYADVPGTEDTAMEESQQKAQEISGSKWAHETQEEKRQEEGDAEMEEDNDEEEEEDEEGSKEGDMKRRVRDGRSLEGLIIKIEVMGDRLDELEEIPRKKRNAIWRGKRNDARMILVNAGDVIERGCYHNTERHQIRGGWRAIRKYYEGSGQIAAANRIEKAELWYLKAKNIWDEAKQDWIMRMVKELSGTVAKIACAVNVDDMKDRKKAEKLRKESNKGKREEEHKKRQQKRFDTLANRQKANKKAKEEASKRVKEVVEKTAREEAERLAALEDLRRKQQEIFEKGKQSATPKEMETNVEEQKKVQAQINKIKSQQKIEKEVSGGKGK